VDEVKAGCNATLQGETSGYRFVVDSLVGITPEAEISGIEKASALSSLFTPVRFHIESALSLLGDRKSPDYRNSIKESISAVESMCKLIARSEKARSVGNVAAGL
jgi:hypothetical protein